MAIATGAAQINATKNGRAIQRLVPIRAARASSWRVVRARSGERLGSILLPPQGVGLRPSRAP